MRLPEETRLKLSLQRGCAPWLELPALPATWHTCNITNARARSLVRASRAWLHLNIRNKLYFLSLQTEATIGFWPLQKLPQRVPHGTPKLGRFRTEKNDWARHDPDRKMSRKLHHIGDRWRVRSISPPWARKMEQQSQNSDFWAGDGAGSMPTVRGALYPVWNIETQKMPVERCDFPIQVAVPQSYFLHIGWFPSEND